MGGDCLRVGGLLFCGRGKVKVRRSFAFGGSGGGEDVGMELRCYETELESSIDEDKSELKDSMKMIGFRRYVSR